MIVTISFNWSAVASPQIRSKSWASTQRIACCITSHLNNFKIYVIKSCERYLNEITLTQNMYLKKRKLHAKEIHLSLDCVSVVNTKAINAEETLALILFQWPFVW